MKMIQPPQDVAVHGDFETTGYAVGDLAFIVDMFADKVYTYKERAVIRELACNAHDSHVEADNEDTNFDIHLPTQLEPWFSMRDYGLGMYDKELRETFGGIGVSTKRDNNKTIGCFGIGSLSPYSLCDSFTVKSWKDGTVRVYSCYRAEDRKPMIALLSEEDSDERNGVEVSLNVEGRVRAFQEEAVNVFKWWDYTPNINNDEVVRQCEAWREHYNFTGDDYAINSDYGDMVAIMGNVAYSIPGEVDEFNCDGYIRFELGEINFDTARENLSLDDLTRAAVKAKFDRIRGEISDEAIAKIQAEPSAYKQAILASKLRSGQLGRLIKGKNLSQFDLPQTTDEMTRWKRNYKAVELGKTRTLPINGIVEYYLPKERMQTRIKYYLKDIAARNTCFVILTNEQVDECKLDRSLLKDMDNLPKVPKVTYASSTGSKVKTFVFDPSYCGYDKSSYYKETELEDNGQEMVYVEISRWQVVGGHGLISSSRSQITCTLDHLKSCGIAVPTVVALKTAFIKTKGFSGGNFIHLDDYVKREYKKKAPTKFFKFDSDQAETLTILSKILVSDELDDFVELAGSSKNGKIADVCRRIGITVEMKEDSFLQDWMDDFFDKYGMLTFLDNWDIKRNKEKVARYVGAELKGAKV